jgi:uncharacterized protein
MDPVLVLFGVCVGLLVGLTGIGGGSLMTPLLILVFGVKPVIAVGTDLAYAAVTKTVGGYRHWRYGTVELQLSCWMALGSVPGAVGGVQVLELLQRADGQSFDRLLLTLLAGALLLTGTATLVRALLVPGLAARERAGLRLDGREKLVAVTMGGFVGLVLGVTSAGSGALVAVGLIVLFRLAPRQVVGTDVFHAALLLWAAAAAHLASGNVDYGLAATILLGSVPGVWLGSHMSVRIPAASLRGALGVVLLGSGVVLLSNRGAVPPGGLVACVLLVLGLVACGSRLRRKRRRAAGKVGVPPAPGIDLRPDREPVEAARMVSKA